MAIEQLIYDSENEVTFCLMVNLEEYDAYKGGDTTIPVASVVNSFDIFKFDNGHEGNLGTPSVRELQDNFSTKNEVEIAEFMLKHGKLHHTFKKKKQAASNDPRGHMM